MRGYEWEISLRKRYGVCLLLAAFLSRSASGQQSTSQATSPPIIRVGDPFMNGSAIQPYDNIWLVTLHPKDGKAIDRGLSTDHVRAVEIQGKRYLARIEGEGDVIAPPGKSPTSSFSTTFNIFDPATMAPLHGESYSSEGDLMVRDFDARTVKTRMRVSAGGAETHVETTTSEPVFDMHGGMTGLLLAALPLAAGFETKLPGFGDGELDYTPIRVVSEEMVGAGHLGWVMAWKVEIGPPPAHSIYWISKKPPYVIRAVVNSSRGYASWDMLN